jgi:phosphohistidine phosphatase
MKTLYIVRHAKSSWDHPELPDYNRPLLETGIARTHKIISYLKAKNVNPGLIICSHAVRARETAVMIAGGLSYPTDKIKVEDRIYNGNEDDSMDLIFGVDNNINELMIVGHNPTFTNLVNTFLDEPLDWLSTSGVVCIEFDTEKWENIFQAKKRTKFVISPKQMKEGKNKK